MDENIIFPYGTITQVYVCNIVIPISAFRCVCVRSKYTSNMAACYDNDINDDTAPYVLYSLM